MGGVTSSAAAARVAAATTSVPPVTPLQVEGLSPGFVRGVGVMVFPCIPEDAALRTRCSILLLEVSKEGFRLLRPETDDALCMHPWGQIHSWAHAESRFTFRYFDDRKRSIQEYSLHLADVPQLLVHVQAVIDAILVERQGAALSEAAVSALLQAVEQAVAGESSGESPVDLMRKAVHGAYLLSDQGRQLIDLLPSSFDKVEAAVILHGHLVDQSRFAMMLEGLDCQADKDNIWHRITALKKQTTRLSSRRADADALAAAVAASAKR